MNDQLQITVKQAEIGSTRIKDIYAELEALVTGYSYLATKHQVRFPELSCGYTEKALRITGGLTQTRNVEIIDPKHPLCGLIYVSLPLVNRKEAYASGGTHWTHRGYFIDKDELVLKYVRKDLFQI